MRRKLKNSELERKTVEEFRAASKIPLTVILDNVRSQNNIGSIFRTADAFLIEEIFLCGISSTPPHPDIQKTALGATDSVKWEYRTNTLEAVKELKEKGYTVLSIEQTENSIRLGDYMQKPGEKYAVVFGHEIHGVDQQVVDASDDVLEVPQFGTKHSVNIAVCAGIVLWDFFQALKQETGIK